MSDYNSLVESVISEDLYGPDGVPPADLVGQQQHDATRFAVEALGVVERHLTGGLAPEQLAALALLRLRGGRYADLAEWYLGHYQRTGPVDPLLRALEALGLLRQFRGVTGRLVGGKGLLGGPAGGR